MQYICDAPPDTWFRLVTHAEAQEESRLMDHAVERYFREAQDKATRSYVPPAGGRFIEQNIGLKDFVQRTMPMFLTLRNNEGKPLATAMLPPGAKSTAGFRPIIVGRANADPYPELGDRIAALARHLGVPLDRDRCYPYHRG
ncbi:MAG: hypothetical protein SFW09_06750 [Hyphomicrobiaceae bacterium]|nr:hypothetical protein [Hyphomicrobiaceae bacterium]